MMSSPDDAFVSAFLFPLTTNTNHSVNRRSILFPSPTSPPTFIHQSPSNFGVPKLQTNRHYLSIVVLFLIFFCLVLTPLLFFFIVFRFYNFEIRYFPSVSFVIVAPSCLAHFWSGENPAGNSFELSATDSFYPKIL